MQDPDCVYTVYVRTGSVLKAGTDSNITLTLYDGNGYGVRINNLEAWGGMMGPGYNYFERGNLDIFSGRGPCLTGPVCAMNLTSDGTGSHHGWYVLFEKVQYFLFCFGARKFNNLDRYLLCNFLDRHCCIISVTVCLARIFVI